MPPPPCGRSPQLAAVADAGQARKIAATIGADVPVCLRRRTCRMRGTGERIDFLDDVPRMPAVLVNPRLALSTAVVFAKLSLAPGRKVFSGLDIAADLASHRNDLTVPALTLAPVIGKVLAALRAHLLCVSPACRARAPPASAFSKQQKLRMKRQGKSPRRMKIGGLLKPPLGECCATFILRGGRETYLSFLCHPGESRDPLNKCKRAALPALKEFTGPGFRRGDELGIG